MSRHLNTVIKLKKYRPLKVALGKVFLAPKQQGMLPCHSSKACKIVCSGFVASLTSHV